MSEEFEFNPPSMIEGLWDEPEHCRICSSIHVVQRLMHFDTKNVPVRINRACSVHAISVEPEYYEQKPNSARLHTGRFIAQNGAKQITEAEMFELRHQGCFMIVDLTVPQNRGRAQMELEWRNRTCPIFVYKTHAGFKVCWRPYMESLGDRPQISWTKDEIVAHKHMNVLYEQLKAIRPRSPSNSMKIDNQSKMMETPAIKSKDEAMVFAQEVWRVESILRDPDQLAVSMVMDT